MTELGAFPQERGQGVRAIANLTIFGQVRSFHWHHSRIWRLSGQTSLAYGLCSPGSSGNPAAITKFAIALDRGYRCVVVE